MRWSRLLLAVAIMTSSLSLVLADVPGMMSYQGVLKDSEGQPVEDDVYAIKFTIYNAETEGAVFWESNGFIPIQTQDGLFTHILGSTNPLPDSLSRYGDLWVGITVNLDEELSPRTRLVSVPFSLNAQYSDTTGTSLDKTIDASELTEGTLDVERFSAYDDLNNEGKIGDAPDQVSAGNHMHTGGSFSGSLNRIEDIIPVIVIPPVGEWITIKTVSIPANLLGHFARISFSIYVAGGSANYSLYINNQLIHDLTNLNNRGDASIFNVVRLIGNDWIVRDISYSGNYSVRMTIDPSSQTDIIIKARSSYPGSEVTVGNLIVEYDVD